MNITSKLPEGFTSRPAAIEDVNEIAAFIRNTELKMYGFDDFDAEEFKTDLQTPDLDLEKDTRVVLNPTGQIVGYQDVFAISAIPVRPDAFGRVHLDYMNLGIGSHLLEWAIERAKHVFDKVPEDARVFMRCWTAAGYQPAVQLLEDHGFELHRHFLGMRINLDTRPPAPVWPEGIEVRTITFPDEVEIWFRTFDESFKDHFGHVDQPFEKAFEQFKYFHLNDPHFDPDLWLIAMDGDEPAGVLKGAKQSTSDPGHGYVNILGVRRQFRKRGIGLGLLRHCFNIYYDRGKKAVELGVDAQSLTGALKLYEDAGMYVHHTTAAYALELRPGKDYTNNG